MRLCDVRNKGFHTFFPETASTGGASWTLAVCDPQGGPQKLNKRCCEKIVWLI